MKMIRIMAVVIPLCAMTFANGQQPEKKADPVPQKKDLRIDGDSAVELRIFPLKHTAADSISDILKHFASNARIVPEMQTNSLIVSAAVNDLKLVTDLVQQLDRSPVTEATRSQLSIVPLRNVVPDQAFETALGFIMARSPYAIDRTRRSIIFNAEPDVRTRVESLVARLETESVPRSVQDVQIRIVWLINDGRGENQNSPPPPDDMKDVLPALAKMGINKPGLAGQLLVSATSDVEYRVHGNVQVWNSADPIQFAADGFFTDKKTGPELNISIKGLNLADKVENFALSSKINAPLGQLVVLGMAPYQQSTSAFIVQVLPKK